MKLFLIKNQLYIITGTVLILCIIVFVSFFTVSDEQTNSPSTVSTPTPDPRYSDTNEPVDGGNYQYTSPADEKALAEDALVGDFISELPYLGKYVRIDYSYADNIFTVKMDPDNVQSAEDEYSNLLKQKGISDDRLKLYNVKIVK